MSYEECVEYILSIPKFAEKLGVDNLKKILDIMEHPEKSYPVVHVAGTNGKGSVCTFLEMMYREEGKRVGRYISPTIHEYLERFQSAISVGDIQSCIEIARQGVSEFPGNFKLLNKLMYALFVSGSSDADIPDWEENMKRYDAEIISLGERIMKYCPDQEIRLEATARLAFQHCEMGRRAQGRAVYETLPPLEYCRENDVNVLFISAPCRINPDDESRTVFLRENRAGEIVEEYGFPFVNFHYRTDEIGLDMERDFYNDAHLNFRGQRKFTEYFVQFLKEEYGVTGGGGTESRRAAWDRSAEYIEYFYEYAQEQADVGEDVFLSERIEVMDALNAIREGRRSHDD